MSPMASTRWCPTSEQLMILEEMYRNGIRTPNAVQIQKITAHLALYGRIEGKNVFYWFQNHKARDRQKLRKKLDKQHKLQLQQIKPKPLILPMMSQPINKNIIDHHNLYHQHHHHHPYGHISFACCSHPSSICLPHKGTREGEAQSKVMNQYYCTKSGAEEMLMQKPITGPNSSDIRDWMMMMMMDMGPRPSYPSSSSSPTPCCNMMLSSAKIPLKTLELFPISSKQDSTKL